MASVFDYPAVLHNQDEARLSHGVEVVGNDQGRLSGHEAIQGFLDLRLALDVEASHRLVQDQDGGAADDGPRYSDPLSLAAREGVAPLADDDLLAQGLELVVLYVSPIDPDGAASGFVEAEDKADQGRLAGSRSADQRHPLAGKDVKGDAFEDLVVISVIE